MDPQKCDELKARAEALHAKMPAARQTAERVRDASPRPAGVDKAARCRRC